VAPAASVLIVMKLRKRRQNGCSKNSEVADG
jgi:hypothetical protein